MKRLFLVSLIWYIFFFTLASPVLAAPANEALPFPPLVASIAGKLTIFKDPTLSTVGMKTLLLGGPTTGAVQLAPTNSVGLFVNNKGNVGVGTKSPWTDFSVGNLFGVNLTTGNLAKITGVSYSWPTTQGGAGTVLTNNGAGILSWLTPNPGTGNGQWQVSGNDLYYQAGRVGVGGVPLTPLHVKYSTSGETGLRVENDASWLGVSQIFVTSANGNGYISAYSSNYNNPDVAGKFVIDSGTGPVRISSSNSNGSIEFWTGYGKRANFNYAGNLGIGTDNATQKLEINGGLRLNPGQFVAKPNCSESVRGTMWFTSGASGEDDSVSICRRVADGSYSWKEL